jgi:hypothetical protein
MLTVHVRVNDAATGKPAPVRIRFRDTQGNDHAPFGRLTDFATGPGEDIGGNVRIGEDRFSYIDGTCEVRLPAGPVRIEAYRGPEYAPLNREVVLRPGQISLRLAIERRVDMAARGWYAGDGRAHELTPHAALLEGQAEGLAVVNLLARLRPAREDRPPHFSNLLAFSGSRPAVEGPGCQVVVNTLNEHPLLGRVALLNCHRPVYPLRSGPPDGADDWSVCDWCDQCHRKKGLVLWAPGDPLTPENPQGEALAAALLGKVDAFELLGPSAPEPAELADWYRLLDCGLRLSLVGSSGKDSNAVPLGALRTYAHLGEGQPFDYAGWIEAVRAGQTFVTNGPLLSLSADGQGPGGVLPIPPGGRTVRVRLDAQSTSPFDRVELLLNGRVVAARETSGDRQAAVLEEELFLTGPGWLAGRCRGQERPAGALPEQEVFAHTAPVYVAAEGTDVRPSAETAAPLAAILERMLDWTAREARCPTQQQREQFAGIFRAAREVLLRRIG